MASLTERKIYNFSAGPSQLPREVLIKAQSELLNWKNTQFSVMEVSHRSKEFEETIKDCENNFRKLMHIPPNYKVIFMQGGATLAFACLPMNLLRGKKTANYLVTGTWSLKCYEEAQKYCKANLVAPIPKNKKFTGIPEQSTWKVDPEGAYFAYCWNETVDGVEFDHIPEVPGQILVCDMSSNIGSRPVDVSKFGCIYGGVQKNLGPSGVAVVIVREDLLDGKVLECTPTLCNWKIQAANSSMYNTPPTFTLYMCNLYFEHMLAKGGIPYYEILTTQKAKLIYDVIESSNGFYLNPVDKRYRSRMNVVFRIKNDDKLENEFVAEAKKQGMIELKGHRSVGGMRASIYNGMPLEAVIKLRDFMVAFMNKKLHETPAPKL